MNFVKGWARRLYFLFSGSVGGTLALTTTNFIELNVKRGQSFDFTDVTDAIAQNGAKEYKFQTGPDPIIIKARLIKTNSDNVDYYAYSNGTLNFTSNGTPKDIKNPNGVLPNTTQVSIFEGPTYTGTGELITQDWIPGVVAIGGRSEGSFSLDGYERILPANTEYLIRLENNGSDPVKVYLFLAWYEGPIVPLGPDEIIPTA